MSARWHDAGYPFQVRFLRTVSAEPERFLVCDEAGAERVEVQMSRRGHYGRLAFKLPEERSGFERLLFMLRLAFDEGRISSL